MKTEIVKLGVVGVDSARLIICDPSYIETEFQAENKSTSLHNEFSLRSIRELTKNENNGGQLNYKEGHEGAAVAFTSGQGDGSYNVFAEIVILKNGERLIKKVWVELITEEELSDLE